MPSEEALRAARAIRAERIRGDRRSSAEADAEIIDAEFQALRDRLELQAAKLDDWIGICEKLRRALGRRGRADCAKCGGSGATYEIEGYHRQECECRKELGL